jgi:hypothetical protein
VSLSRDTALEVMGWKERAGAKSHPHYGWDRAGRPSISAEMWRPETDLTQAFEVLRAATRGQGVHIEVHTGAASDLYSAESGGHSAGPGLSLGEILCTLALKVRRDA